ncbi:MAG TPA: hypothetical protein IGS53_20255 [Leptolyngbyaceae cyanobacterium M33_DOE_097]|uniref:Uncharacterized protein n=1 Tax=Oscillatoriales cyanobacterium SpSt-418 TaxID=2282169 RepID=A0A7C3PTI7_9CYAN|nr:hypothetical protein [Leptolyngbyaceae cyanobacterium M33_DOE_097]
MKFEGTWHITDMENWDEDYFNMEVQAYIEIDKRGAGDFQFGLVAGQIDGEIVKEGKSEKLEFTWEGRDENDEAFGSGWLKLKDKNELEGKIKFHQGDSSLFTAKRV